MVLTNLGIAVVGKTNSGVQYQKKVEGLELHKEK